MTQIIHSNFLKRCFFWGGILVLGGCSENFEGFSNLSEVGERPILPSSIDAQKKIEFLEEDRMLILKKAS